MADDIEDSGEDNTKSELVRWARGKLREFESATGDWRTEALDAFACVAGNQWDESTRESLEADDRPIFTFNRVASFIRGICGLESATRNQVQLFARELDDTGAADVLNAAVRYVREGCDADDEDSDAFKDMLICGMGWTETMFTNEEDADGNIVIERVDPLHMRWDPAARKRGLTDRRWNAREKYLPLSTIRDIWGASKADEVEGVLASDAEVFDEFSSSPHDATAARNYDSDAAGQARRKNGVPVVQFQYVKTARFTAVINPTTGQEEEVTAEEFINMQKLMRRQGMEITGRQVKHRQYRQVIFCGDVELEEGPLPCSGFTFQPITGIRDRNEGIWYGFVRDLLDPQRWVNKFFSAMADVVASQAKGGLMAEADAFVNKDNAAEDWNNPRSIVWLKRDGLGKVKERNAAGVPAGLNQLLDFTVSSLPAVAGVNLEFLGMADREQPGVLEHQRKQAAISTLSEFFNALRLYRKQQGRILLKFIDEFISDGRLIRIAGKKDAQYVPLVRMPGTLRYDIVVDEAPTSPDQKNRTWQALTQILPIAGSMGLPIPPEIIEYAPFPQQLIDDWKKYADENAAGPPKIQAQMQQMQQQMQALQKQNQDLKSKKDESMAKMQATQAENQQKMQMQQGTSQVQAQLDRDKAAAQTQLEQAKAAAQLELEQTRVRAQIELEQFKAAAQLDLEKSKAQSQMDLERQKLAMQLQIEQEKADTQLMVADITAGGTGGVGLTAMLRQTHEDTANAMAEVMRAMETTTEAHKALTEAYNAPKTITDAKGRKFTVKRGE